MAVNSFSYPEQAFPERTLRNVCAYVAEVLRNKQNVTTSRISDLLSEINKVFQVHPIIPWSEKEASLIKRMRLLKKIVEQILNEITNTGEVNPLHWKKLELFISRNSFL